MVASTLREVADVELTRGLLLPAGLSARQLLITGPPGSGKSTEVATLGGWPEEGFLDLSERRWWRSAAFRFLPCEAHLGLPFQGHPKALTLFDEEWLQAEPAPRVNLSRVYLPPKGRWRRKYAFAFLLPPAEHVFAAREERAYRQSHLVDEALSREKIEAQIEAYRTVAQHLHRAGLRVFVRDEYGGPPKVFQSEMRGGGSPWVESGKHVHQPLIARLFDAIAGTSSAPVVGRLDEMRLAGDKVRLPLEVLPADLALGPQRLRVLPERFLDAEAEPVPPDLLVFDPDEYEERISGFVRLRPGDRTRIGKGEEDRVVTPRLPRNILPRLEIAYDGQLVSLVDLHSPGGTAVAPAPPGAAGRPRKEALERLAEIGSVYGGSVERLAPEDALTSLRRVNELLESQAFRAPDDRGRPGGLVELPVDVTPVLIGDLHGSVDNLLKVLSGNRILEGLRDGSTCVILLGDAVHPEEGDLEDMDDSIVMMDLLTRMMSAFPEHFLYLRGNHDSFSREVMKGGVPQGRVWRKRLREARGMEYVDELSSFYDRIPVVACSTDFVACHGGPPLEHVSRERLINLHRHPQLSHQLSWNRLQKASNPAGYTKREVRAFKGALGLAGSQALIVAHTPEPGGETVWLDHGGIRGHHIVHSADDAWVGTFTRIGGEMTPLVYPAEPCRRWVEEGRTASSPARVPPPGAGS